MIIVIIDEPDEKKVTLEIRNNLNEVRNSVKNQDLLWNWIFTLW